MRILEITSELDGGGVDRLLYDYCSRIIPEIEFDFVVTSKSVGILERKLEDIGCTIFHIPQLHESVRKHNEAIRTILNNKKYDIVHDHSGYKAALALKVAKGCGVNVRIAHSHQAFIDESNKQRIIRKLLTPLTKYYATKLFACGLDAAKWMWGNTQDVYIMRNSINIEKFKFDIYKRETIRKKLKMDDKFVIGNVARFSYQKNHKFLIDTFQLILQDCPNAVLMLVGQGELMSEIGMLIEEKGIQDSVRMLGVRDDVPELLNAMDVFVLPSHYEGLPVTLVEVQANSLVAIVSDTITTEIRLNSNVYYLPLSKGTRYWAQKIVSVDKERKCIGNDTFLYDINKSVLELKKMYINLRSGDGK